MEAEEENCGSTNLKRQRAPLSDSEDNIFTPSEGNDVQKRRRLEGAGQENRSPTPSSSGRLLELETKPDTPMVPSIRSRIQLLTQRQQGVAPLTQRCLSDPGAVSPSIIIHEKAFKEHVLGEGEFSQRMERFKVPLFQASPAPTPSSANSCQRTCSNFVSGIQQKLQGATTPSTKQEVRMRQEREQELNQLPFQPISENAWLKRSSSDPTLTQAAGDAEMKDGSFTEASTSSAKMQSPYRTGQTPCCDSEAPSATAEFENSNQELRVQQQEKNTHLGKEIGGEIDSKASDGGEGLLRLQKSQIKTVMQLSFSEDQSSFSPLFGEEQSVSELPTGDDQSLLEFTYAEESNTKKPCEGSREKEIRRSEANSLNSSFHNEEVMENSSEEDLRLWRYPQESKEKSVLSEQDEDVSHKEEEEEEKSSRAVEVMEACGSGHSGPADTECGDFYPSLVSAGVGSSSEIMKNKGDTGPESCLEDESNENIEYPEGRFSEKVKENNSTKEMDSYDTKECTQEEDLCQQSKETHTVSITEEDLHLESNSRDRSDKEKLLCADEGLEDTVMETIQEKDTEVKSLDTDECEVDYSLMENQASHTSLEMVQAVCADMRDSVGETLLEDGGESSKKVSFILEPELINSVPLSASNAPMESRVGTSLSDSELNSHDETNTAEIIDQMFEEVLEYAGMIEEEREHHEDTEDRDSGIGASSAENTKMDTESEKEKSEEEGETNKEEEEDCDECMKPEKDGDDLLTFPPSCILSPLSKSVEAVVTPLRLAVSQESNPPSLILTPEETLTPPAETAPLYSIDAYRTQRQSKPSTFLSVTPEIQSRAPEKVQPLPSVNTKEKLKALNEEAGKLQIVIGQTLQALSCCTDEDHGRGSLEEAEAEKLLLVSCEKRSALLAEMARLREERKSEAAGEDKKHNTQQPCRGTVSISKIQLPLKVEFVCSSHSQTGRPSHYFFILIRYGPCNIIATPLATAADAKNGDTISFPTSVTLKDIRSTFEIDVEVYSLSHTTGNNCTIDRPTTKSRVTPRKLLNTLTRAGHNLTTAAAPALSTRRSSNFCLVGSHKVTLASLGHGKFPLDKMKLEGKIRRLLGDEFQEKVPFLSPLEGSIYLQLDSESHSNVQHQGFLTMFELISGYGVWHRRYFVLDGCDMSYWNHPNDRETKQAEGSISLCSSHSQCVRPVKRDSCARPFTFELVSNVPEQHEDSSQEAIAKCWFSADTKQERLDWMEKLNQVLLDFHTWNRTPAAQTGSQEPDTSGGGNLRESIL